MAIQVSCPSCRSEAAVDDSLAGKDVLCPHCQARITVPSLAAGAPDELRAVERRALERRAPAWDDSGYSEEMSTPRYRGADEDFSSSRDATAAWGTTATGLGLIFWSGAFLAVITAIMNLLGMFLGNNPQGMGMGGAGGGMGGGPAPAAAGVLGATMLAGCLIFILIVVSFVGMCMCCTAPPESGARGRAIATVVGTVLYVLGVIVVSVVSTFAAVNQIRQGGGPQPGQMPFPPGLFITLMVVGGVAGVILMWLWMMFHKAVADHFQYPGLARASVLFVIAFVGFTLVGQVLNLIANPQMLEGNLLAPPPNPTLALLAQAWGLLGMVALMVWFLVIVRETRRTILGTGEEEHELT
jgi:hypothetical protein